MASLVCGACLCWGPRATPPLPCADILTNGPYGPLPTNASACSSLTRSGFTAGFGTAPNPAWLALAHASMGAGPSRCCPCRRPPQILAVQARDKHMLGVMPHAQIKRPHRRIRTIACNKPKRCYEHCSNNLISRSNHTCLLPQPSRRREQQALTGYRHTVTSQAALQRMRFLVHIEALLN
jgi:hypothetical protein